MKRLIDIQCRLLYFGFGSEYGGAGEVFGAGEIHLRGYELSARYLDYGDV